jgi:hypothetical protein
VSDLRLEVARFAAVDAVVHSILAQPHVVLAHAERAEALALAAALILLTLEALEWISHSGNVA